MAFLKSREGRMTGKSFDSPVLTSPALGTPSAGVMTNMTGAVTASVVNNNVQNAHLASGTDGNIISYDASGNPVAIATGNDGQVLVSAGAGAPPSFSTAATGGLAHVITADLPTTAITTGSTFADFYSSSYTSYYVVIRDMETGSDTDRIGFQFNQTSDGTVESGSNYETALVGIASTDPAYNIGEKDKTYALICPNLGNAAGELYVATLMVSGMQNSAVYGTLHGTIGWIHGSDYLVAGQIAAYYSGNATTSFSGFTIFTDEGNFAGGSITVFGIVES